MFKTEKGIEINADLNVSVSHATLRTEDLLPVFMEIIKNCPEYPDLKMQIPDNLKEGDSWYESEDCADLLDETLFDLLDAHAPEGFYFGTTEGNSSDFGFWEEEEFETHGIYTLTCCHNMEVMLHETGEAARLRWWLDGQNRYKYTGWLPIEVVFDQKAAFDCIENGMEDDPEGDFFKPIIDPKGFAINMNKVMRIANP